jgi:hypothetical protein
MNIDPNKVGGQTEMTVVLPYRSWETVIRILNGGPYSEVVDVLYALSSQLVPQVDAATRAIQTQLAEAAAAAEAIPVTATVN